MDTVEEGLGAVRTYAQTQEQLKSPLFCLRVACMVMHSTNLLAATHLHGHFASQISHLFSNRDLVAGNLWQLIDNNKFIN